jgi:hypothetical protein
MEHPMMTKAAKGIDAIRMLRRGEAGSYEYPDDAASRLYYALYHACWAFLQSQSPPVPFDEKPDYQGDPDSYAHSKLEGHLLRFPAFTKAAGDDWRANLSAALRNRIQADYRPDPVVSFKVERVADKLGHVINGLDGFLKGQRL